MKLLTAIVLAFFFFVVMTPFVLLGFVFGMCWGAWAQGVHLWDRTSECIDKNYATDD